MRCCTSGSKVMLYSLMIAMLLTGTCDVILFKTQSQQEYYNTDKKKTMNFEHPFVQSAIAFLGEMLCLIYYYSYIYFKNRKNQNESEELMEAQKKGLKTNINVALLAIPALFNIFGSSLMFIALTLVAASIYQMLRGFVIIMTTIQSIIILRRRYQRHHYLSLFFIVCGVGIVGVSPIIFPEGTNTETSKNPILGVIIILCAQFFTAGLMISEEKILKNYYLHPLKVVGWEGFWGFSIYIFILIILYFIPCNNEDICPYGKVEDVPHAVYEMGENSWIWILGIVTLFSISAFNSTGVGVTKYASATQRCTIDTSRTLLVWTFFLFKPGKGKERFIWLQLIGFLLLVLGTLVFNEILTIPFLGLDKYTKPLLITPSAPLNYSLIDPDIDKTRSSL